MSTYIVYKTLAESYKRLGRDIASLADKIDLSFALGRLSDAEYTELVKSINAEDSIEQLETEEPI